MTGLQNLLSSLPSFLPRECEMLWKFMVQVLICILIMVETVLPDVSSIIAFMNVLEYLFYTFDGGAYFNIHVAVEPHKQLGIVLYNP